ncbi:PLP-dependent aminotransferase family protein [Conexibacter sp. DBS9H8]|uniref:aminotransferase-like domain-containing protein n=1 Tax=Conexibacter sp. DBS9H8 TaxID=2937801 RepID=UPI00200F0850|nr:PLP-dependent aminotransferase family protein [Conexibacter sp. DBS9H8]
MSAATISFARGAPSLDIVDVSGLAVAAQAAFAADPAGLTGYGTAVGYGPLREWIAHQHDVSPDHVIVTNGSMQADAFLFDTLVQAGDTVVVEAPTYDRTLLALRERGAAVLAIPLEADGIDVGALERALSAGAAPTLAHIIPNFQNPAGYTLSLQKRRALLGLAAEYGFTIFEDDPYREVRFSGESLPTMLSLDPARVVYASSFSKIVCPGVRVGYLVGQPELIAQITRLATNTYISPSMLAQGIVNQFVRSDAFSAAIATVKSALAQRAAALGAALARELPDARFQIPDGGYFMWVQLPEDTDGDALHAAALERGLQFVKGSDFLIEGGASALRIAYSGVSVAEIDEGVRRLADAYAAVTARADAAA